VESILLDRKLIEIQPFSGTVRDASGAKLGDLQLGCTYTGGAADGVPGGGTPATTAISTGLDLRAELTASSEPGRLGCTLGTGAERRPPICIVNIVDRDVFGEIDVSTGEITLNLPLATRAFPVPMHAPHPCRAATLFN
jgi:hypothetical protein